MGGSKKGVMPGHAKWAFLSRKSAERFIKANGGAIVRFDKAIKVAYDDMYQNTKMIRESQKGVKTRAVVKVWILRIECDISPMH